MSLSIPVPHRYNALKSCLALPMYVLSIADLLTLIPVSSCFNWWVSCNLGFLVYHMCSFTIPGIVRVSLVYPFVIEYA